MAIAILLRVLQALILRPQPLVVSLAWKGLLETIQETVRSSPPGSRACRWGTSSTRAGLLGEPRRLLSCPICERSLRSQLVIARCEGRERRCLAPFVGARPATADLERGPRSVRIHSVSVASVPIDDGILYEKPLAAPSSASRHVNDGSSSVWRPPGRYHHFSPSLQHTSGGPVRYHEA
jgi:hypothetical protein